MRDHGIHRNLLQPDSKAGTTWPSVACRFQSAVLCNADGSLIRWTLRIATYLKVRSLRMKSSNVLAQGRVAGLPAERPSGAMGWTSYDVKLRCEMLKSIDETVADLGKRIQKLLAVFELNAQGWS